jgi:hypothetical protein
MAVIGTWISTILLATKPTTDELEIRTLVTQALQVKQTLDVPPPVPSGTSTEMLRDLMLLRVRPDLGRYYTGEPLARLVKTFEAAIRNSGNSGVVVSGGGVTWASVNEISVKAPRASASARAKIWKDIGQNFGNPPVITASPKNEISCNFSLIKVDASWLIDGEECGFVPGQGP